MVRLCLLPWPLALFVEVVLGFEFQIVLCFEFHPSCSCQSDCDCCTVVCVLNISIEIVVEVTDEKSRHGDEGNFLLDESTTDWQFNSTLSLDEDRCGDASAGMVSKKDGLGLLRGTAGSPEEPL